jgi:hypothetical protein
MDFFEQLFSRIPEAPELEEEARIWMPSLPMVNIIVDALMCRLADAKVGRHRFRCVQPLGVTVGVSAFALGAHSDEVQGGSFFHFEENRRNYHGSQVERKFCVACFCFVRLVLKWPCVS